MRLSHNLASINIYREQVKIQDKQSEAMNRISSGYKVNSAKDDPNVIAQSERMRMQIRGLEVAGENVQDGTSMLQTFEGGLDSMTSMLQRVRELSVKASNVATTSDDRSIIKGEIDQLIDGMDDIVKNTSFNGVNPFTQNAKISMPSGANVGENIEIPLYKLDSASLLSETSGGTTKTLKDDLNFDSLSDANKAIEISDNALSKMLNVRAEYGAIENRFEDSYNNISEIADKLQGADSLLTDSDIAAEMLELSKDNILSEAGTAMMAQSNKLPQDVLRILENVRG